MKKTVIRKLDDTSWLAQIVKDRMDVEFDKSATSPRWHCLNTLHIIVNEADDTDNHILKVDGRGKGRLAISVDNPANQTVTVTIYGMHAATGAVGDVGTFLIGSFTVTATDDKGYETINDPFPWYLIQLAYAVTPTDNPLKTATVYADFSAF